MNRGADVSVLYTPTERRVRLDRGEANFKVAKANERPFFVLVGGFRVRAVGTEFNVRLTGGVSVMICARTRWWSGHCVATRD